MKTITNYSYDIDYDGTLTIYTTVNNQTYTIATLEDCVRPSANNRGICELIEDVLNEFGYELELKH